MKHIFFIGIGGKGLNGIAQICLERGFKVSGVDMADKKEIRDLSHSGAKIYKEHKRSNIKKGMDLVVYSSIISCDCPEILQAKKLGIRLVKRSQFLDELTRNDFRISVCGSHGKSTTTALIGLSLINSNVDASIYGGAQTRELNGHNHHGKSKYTVIESCEYDRSFYDLVGNISVITSVEKSHMEYYKDEKDMLDAFRFFISKHNNKSIIVANGDSMKIRKLTAGIDAKVVYFGFDNRNDYVVRDVIQTKEGSEFSVYKNSEKIIDSLNINIPGTYNILNFAVSSVLLNLLGLSTEGVRETAKNFTGVGRRFEIMKAETGQIFVDDFAHHPTQVQYLFDGIDQFFPDQKTCAIFQPRQYNLMKNFVKEYGQAFKKADEVILTDILPCLGDSEEDIKSISSEDLANSISKYSGVPVRIMNDFGGIVDYLRGKYLGNSVITTIGAGDVYKIRDQFLNLPV